METSNAVDGQGGQLLKQMALKGKEKEKEKEREIHPLAAFLASHGIDSFDEDGDEDGDDEDEEWQPHVRWNCLNCTMPNPSEEDNCLKCNEHRESSVVEKGFMAPLSPLIGILQKHLQDQVLSHGQKASVIIKDYNEKVVKSMEDVEQNSAGRLSQHLMFSGTFMSGKERKTAVGFDDRMLLHEETGKIHPERPDRLRAIMGGLEASGLFPGRCFTIPPREATHAELQLVHSAEHISKVEATEGNELSHFTVDTYANEHSAVAARLAAGICADLASVIMSGKAHNGFAAVRPPGHHAEEQEIMGFCLHNNACVAARAAQTAGASKVLIVDWDVHHGNGTQEIFERDPSVLYVSLHRHEDGAFYPGTGGARLVGSGPGEGFCVNIPWGCGGIGDRDYLSAFQHLVMPIARQFDPDLTIISAGFDAARGDPLGGCDVTPVGYAHMTSLLSTLSGGRMLVILEGGYNLRSISASAAAVVKVLQGDHPAPLPDNLQPSATGAAAMLEVFTIQQQYWSNLSEATFLKLGALLMKLTNDMDRKRILKRRHTGGPVWWKWGRRRVLYDIWLRTKMKHHSDDRTHDHHCCAC